MTGDGGELERALEWLSTEIRDFLEDIRHLDVAPAKVEPEDIESHLGERYDFARPLPLEDVLADIRDMLRRWNVHVTSPRYFGYFNPSVTPAAIVGDALAALYNPQIAVWSHAPAAAEIERHVLAFIARRLGLDPERSIAHFTSGGAEANHTATLAALMRRDPGYGDKGLRLAAAANRWPTIYVSAESHHSFVKIAHATGIGRDALRMIRVDPKTLRIDVDALLATIAEDREQGLDPLMLVATAGTTAAGIVDPLPRLAEVARREKLWLHVDAAWGGAAALSSRLPTLLDGIERADSITFDAHKWLSVPMGAGMFFSRHREIVLRCFRVATGYMPRSNERSLDPYASTMQWSRRAIGLKLFASLATSGETGLRAMIDHQIDMGERLRELLRERGFEILNDTPLPVVCFTSPATRGDADATRRAADRVVESGEAWISIAILGNGAPALRACITSYRTEEADLARMVSAVERALTN